MERAAMRVADLTKVYKTAKKGEFRAVNGVSFDARPGEIFGFLGPNGAGKTTTIKMICGLIEPTSGQVQLNGYDIRRQRKQAVAQFGAVLEGGRNVYWNLTARQNLQFFAALKHAAGAGLTERIDQLLRDFDLESVQHNLVGRFSRGMQQKVAIAAALVADPAILILDEPTLGLDVTAARIVRQQVVKLREQGKTILLTTHQMDLAEELCDRIAIIQGGEIRAMESTRDLVHVFGQRRSRILLRGHVSPAMVRELSTLGVQATEQDGLIVVDGPVANDTADQVTVILQSALKHGLHVQSVVEERSSLEDVFVSLTEVAQRA